MSTWTVVAAGGAEAVRTGTWESGATVAGAGLWFVLGRRGPRRHDAPPAEAWPFRWSTRA